MGVEEKGWWLKRNYSRFFDTVIDLRLQCSESNPHLGSISVSSLVTLDVNEHWNYSTTTIAGDIIGGRILVLFSITGIGVSP